MVRPVDRPAPGGPSRTHEELESPSVSMFAELRKRHLVEIALVYLGAGWLFIEIADFVVNEYGFSRKVLDTVVLLAILGFPAFLIIGWFHGERGHQRVQRGEAWMLATLGVLAAVGTYRIATAEQAFMGTPPAATAPAGDADARLASADRTPDLGRRSVAVLPFRNNVASDSLEWLGSGLADLLTTDFAQLPDLRVVGRQSLYDLLTEEGRAESEEIPESLAASVARAAGARMMVWGSVSGTPGDLAIDAQVIELDEGTVVAGERVRGSDVFALVDSLAARLAPHLGGERRRLPIRVSQLGTHDMEAFGAFQEGIALERAGRMEEAAKLFERAAEMDSSFVLPLVRLAGRDENRAHAAPEALTDSARARRAADWHRERALRILRRLGDDFEFSFEDMSEDNILAALDSTLGRALSKVTVVVGAGPDSLPPPPPRGARQDRDPPR